LEQEEKSVQELSDYETIIVKEAPFNKAEIDNADQVLIVTDNDNIVKIYLNYLASFPFQLLKAPDTIRLHNINNGSARPKNITITRVREAMSSGGLTNTALSDIIVEVFFITYKTRKYILGEESLLGTSICRFSGIDLLSDYHLPETTHFAHIVVIQCAIKESFEKHLLPLNVPYIYYSQGLTKKQNPKLYGWARSKTR
jgi:hypothetical protein